MRRLATPGGPSPLNVPNALSLARIAMVPALLVALFDAPDGSSSLAAALFCLASVTDVLDGHLARTRELVTDLGKILDPLADKLLVVSVLLALVALERVALWVVAVILGREVVISLVRQYAGRRGVTVAARPLGKLKMGLQVLAVLLLLTAPDPATPEILAVVYTAVAVTIVSGLDCAVATGRRLAHAR